MAGLFLARDSGRTHGFVAIGEHFSQASPANRTPVITLTGRSDDGSPRVRGLTITADKRPSDIATTWSHSRSPVNVSMQAH